MAARKRATKTRSSREKSKVKPRQGAKKKTSTTKTSDSAPRSGETGELIDMQEAIELLKTTRPTFYRWLRSGKIKGMKVGRQWRFYRDDIDRFLKGEEPRIGLSADITPLIKTLSKKLKEVTGRKVPQLDESELVRAADLIMALGVATNSSDIHIAPQMTDHGREPETIMRLRIDGVLHRVTDMDNRLLPPLVEEFKRRAGCDIHTKDRPQDGRILNKMVIPGSGKSEKMLDFRASFLPTGLGEALTFRILDSSAVSIGLDVIEFSESDRDRLMQALGSPWGLLVISGPTGSGKTTTLYSCLSERTGPKVKTVSVEDPIEYYLPWVNQVAVNPSAGVTFSSAVKAILRTDPDVIAVGEIRDSETLLGALQAALTGHLVMTQMHAPTAVKALTRMGVLGIDVFMITEATKLVLAQRLVRKLCVECSEKYKPTTTELDRMAAIARDGGLNWHSLKRNFRRAVGCDACTRTGYKRRNVITETLVVTPEIAKALSADASHEEIQDIAINQGMVTLAADGVRKAASGETTIEEVLRVLGLSGKY